MFERILMLGILWLGMIFYDVAKLKKTNRKERIVYWMLMIPITYLSLIYIMDLTWPNLDELFHFFFSEPAKYIVKTIQVPI